MKIWMRKNMRKRRNQAKKKLNKGHEIRKKIK